MQVELKVNDKSVQAEISEEQAKILGLITDKPKTGYERTKIGETYYCVEEKDYLICYAERNDSADDSFYAIGDYYSDETIAENNARADRLLRRLRQWQAQNDRAVTKKDWGNSLARKFRIKYNHFDDKLMMVGEEYFQDVNVIYFSSMEKADEAIEQFKDELLWYFTEYVQRLDEAQNG